jgi:hypothetical protein
LARILLNPLGVESTRLISAIDEFAHPRRRGKRQNLAMAGSGGDSRRQVTAAARARKHQSSGATMSSSGISSIVASQAQTLQSPSFDHPARKKTNAAGQTDSSAGAIGQLPVGAGQNLFSNAMQAIEQTISKAV